ncbi:hypothetical protein XAP412_830010 [Xanthomonas phaseoli pv. phaseoli]|uniref:Uncharacterized protein n=1 Tax=Xanthomonas campestris pv. phaseoli TaxID=317013 RepID=A0AB38E752_XANCH|nr:hypothetical protein XAP6984_860011 [Xanthomonas phaseoli pv. phaseoli]SON90895.1 hypothetical protein XAP412_830010 [Xanthomonas phaseoli pv. phaseoli]SON92690.1 hypothetical protein XAP7430_830011 [Xanthomonas phaseoli pv. phaseoli]SOO29628.1 hypothetical protein XAP6164_3470006 [Xanthomonas phaseoli pv. phaseoli]
MSRQNSLDRTGPPAVPIPSSLIPNPDSQPFVLGYSIDLRQAGRPMRSPHQRRLAQIADTDLMRYIGDLHRSTDLFSRLREKVPEGRMRALSLSSHD